MDTPITLNPVIPADACGYQTWLVALPCGTEVAVQANSEESAIKVWRFAGAYSARPMRENDLAEVVRQTDACSKSWGRLD